MIIVLNDNGRSYAPTVSRLSTALTRVRLDPSYMRTRAWAHRIAKGVPLIGGLLARGVAGASAAMRELVTPHAFFEALGVRYTGPIDGHDVGGLERAFSHAAEYDGGPIVIHVVTQKGKGYSFAEDDEEKCLHDVPVFDPVTGPIVAPGAPVTWTEAFTAAIIEAAELDERVHAITAAMPGPTGLLPFQARFPDRFRDVGIAEQHAVTAAAGMAMGGLRPVVALYSTFLTRAFDQANLDVGLHAMPVVFCLDRAGITGDDGASHHGVLDLALLTKIPGMTVLAPSSAQELAVMLREALTIDTGPVAIRWPTGAAGLVEPGQVGSGLSARQVRAGDDVCILAVGRMVEAAEAAADLLQRERGLTATVWDVRSVKPLDRQMLVDAARHPLVVTVEDGIREGGAGTSMADALAGLDEARRCPPVVVLGTPVDYIPQGKAMQILANLGLDGPGIAAAAAKALRPTTEEGGA